MFKKRECFESSFQRLSTNIISTTRVAFPEMKLSTLSKTDWSRDNLLRTQRCIYGTTDNLRPPSLGSSKLFLSQSKLPLLGLALGRSKLSLGRTKLSLGLNKLSKILKNKTLE